MLLLLLPLLACTTASDSGTDSADTDSDTDSDTDTDTDSDTDTDTDPTGLFLSATGTMDGDAVTFACDETSEAWEFGSTARDIEGKYQLAGICADTSSTWSLNLGAYTDAPATSDACIPNQWGVQVVAGDSSFWNCAVDGTSAFEFVVDELTVEGDGSVLWGGSFRAAGDGESMFHEADLTGTFRFRGAPI